MLWTCSEYSFMQLQNPQITTVTLGVDPLLGLTVCIQSREAKRLRRTGPSIPHADSKVSDGMIIRRCLCQQTHFVSTISHCSKRIQTCRHPIIAVYLFLTSVPKRCPIKNTWLIVNSSGLNPSLVGSSPSEPRRAIKTQMTCLGLSGEAGFVKLCVRW